MSMYMHLAWNDWLYSSVVTVRTCRAHWIFFDAALTHTAGLVLLFSFEVFALKYFFQISHTHLPTCSSTSQFQLIMANKCFIICILIENYLETTPVTQMLQFYAVSTAKACGKQTLLWWITAWRSRSLTNILCHLKVLDVWNTGLE